MPQAEIADTFAVLRRKDEAFEWMKRACDERAAALGYLKVAQVYDPLRFDPRFSATLKARPSDIALFLRSVPSCEPAWFT